MASHPQIGVDLCRYIGGGLRPELNEKNNRLVAESRRHKYVRTVRARVRMWWLSAGEKQ